MSEIKSFETLIFFFLFNSCISFKVLEYTDSSSKKKVVVNESSQYNPKTEINRLTWYFSFENDKVFSVERFSMRMFFPSKMNHLLIDSGFKILHQWGDYYRTPLGEGSKLQIYDVQAAF